MPVNYDEVLADLKRRKTELEAAILGIEGLVGRPRVADCAHLEEPMVLIHSGSDDGDENATSVPQLVVQFLEGQPGKSFAIADIAKEIGAKSIPTLRGALGRLVKASKIGKHGRGRYRAPRAKAQAEPEV